MSEKRVGVEKGGVEGTREPEKKESRDLKKRQNVTKANKNEEKWREKREQIRKKR